MSDQETIAHALAEAVDRGVEQVHIVARGPHGATQQVLARRHGVLDTWDTAPPGLAAAVLDSLDGRARRRVDDGKATSAVFTAASTRFRARLKKTPTGTTVVLQSIASAPPPAETLGLPPHLLDVRSGLVLVAGPRTSGRTTTAHAWVGHIHATRSEDITIIESPPEVLHGPGRSHVLQRAVGQDAGSLRDALLATVDGPTSVVMIDGLDRDGAAFRTALDVATAGRLVIATVCADTIASALGACVVGTRPLDYAHTLRALADALCAVTLQRRLPSVAGPLVTARAYLQASSAVRAAISAASRERPSHCLLRSNALKPTTGLDDAIAALVQSKTVSPEVARRYATRPQRFGD